MLGHYPKSVRLSPENQKQVVFYYALTPDLQDTVDQFWRGEIKVEPSRFFGAITGVKSRIYNCLKDYGRIR